MDLTIKVDKDAPNLTEGLGITLERANALLKSLEGAFEERQIDDTGQIELDKLIEGMSVKCTTPGELFWLALRLGQFTKLHNINV
jgi:hypothetical protein